MQVKFHQKTRACLKHFVHGYGMWDKETLIAPIFIGALASIPNESFLDCFLKKLGISYNEGALASMFC